MATVYDLLNPDSTEVEEQRVIRAPGATTGDVLTVQSDQSIAPAPGGGSQPTITVADTPPTDPVEGDLWLRVLDAASTFQLYVRNDATTWVPASGGVGSAATIGLFGDLANRQVGLLIGDPGDGNLTGLEVDAAGETARIKSTDEDGNVNAYVEANASYARLQHGSARLSHDTNGWRISGLPTEDPLLDNYFWLDNGVLTISSGTP